MTTDDPFADFDSMSPEETSDWMNSIGDSRRDWAFDANDDDNDDSEDISFSEELNLEAEDDAPESESDGFSWLRNLADNPDDDSAALDAEVDDGFAQTLNEEVEESDRDPLAWLQGIANDPGTILDDTEPPADTPTTLQRLDEPLTGDTSSPLDTGEDPLEWLETLAKRQGAPDEELITDADFDIPLFPETPTEQPLQTIDTETITSVNDREDPSAFLDSLVADAEDEAKATRRPSTLVTLTKDFVDESVQTPDEPQEPLVEDAEESDLVADIQEIVTETASEQSEDSEVEAEETIAELENGASTPPEDSTRYFPDWLLDEDSIGEYSDMYDIFADNDDPSAVESQLQTLRDMAKVEGETEDAVEPFGLQTETPHHEAETEEFLSWLETISPTSQEQEPIPDWITDSMPDGTPSEFIDTTPAIEQPSQPKQITVLPSPQVKVNLEDTLKEARYHVRNGVIDSALKEYETLIQANTEIDNVILDLYKIVNHPSHHTKAAVYRVLGDGLMRQGRLQDALDTYKRALNLL